MFRCYLQSKEVHMRQNTGRSHNNRKAPRPGTRTSGKRRLIRNLRDKTLRLTVAVSPAVITIAAMIVISLVTGHPQDLFLTRSTIGIPVRFVLITTVLVVPIAALPGLLAMLGKLWTHEKILGKLVRMPIDADQECCKPIVWGLRPLQGIGLHISLAEKFLSFLEFSVGASFQTLLARATLFLIGSALVSLFLSTIWALDDLGVRIYNSGTGEVNMAGRSVGIILPLITGAVGITSLFHRSLPFDALSDVVQIIMVLYPPYIFFAIIHNEFLRKRSVALLEKLRLATIATRLEVP